MSEWQPIETAPKDRTHILLFVGNDKPQIVVAYYESFVTEDGTVEWWAYADWLLQDAAGEIFGPTHWMPLPPPPQTGDEG